MEFRPKRLALIAALMLPAVSAHAASSDVWLWDGAQRFSDAANCQNRTEAHTPFRVTVSTDTKTQAKLLAPADAKALPLSAQTNLKELGDSVLMLKADAPTVKIGKNTFDLSQAFLQVAEDSEGYSVLTCDVDKVKVDYVAFDLFVNGSASPIARVAINPDVPGLLASARVLSPDDAEKLAAKESQAGPNAEAVLTSMTAGRRTLMAKLKTPPEPTSTKKIKAAAPLIEPTPSEAVVRTHKTTPSLAPRLDEPTIDKEASTDDPILDGIGGIPVIGGPLAYVICSIQDSITVQDQSLQDTLFTAKRSEEARPMQTFDPSKPVREFAVNHHAYIKVTFPDRPAGHNIGWIEENDLRLRQKCPYLKGPVPVPVDRESRVAGFNFPVKGRPLRSYKEGGRRFRAERASGRLHAACDLYRPGGEAVQSIDDAQVIRSKYYFYEGVYAIEAVNRNGYVVRYGEILGRNAPGAESGDHLRKGQTLGYVGTVNSGCCSPMLHFELYQGTSTGALTQRSRSGFQRRADLLDPTADLAEWEKKKFGASY